jgi:ABC-2 type transport system ATP-binding protein
MPGSSTSCKSQVKRRHVSNEHRRGRLADLPRSGNNRRPVTDPVAVPLLALDAVSRSLAGRTVLRALTLSVAKGEVLGLLGVNGAGKSTTLRLISGVLAPDAGTVRLQGADLYSQPELARRGIGYLPERAPLHAELNVIEYLAFCARLRGLAAKPARAAVARELQRCDLGEVQHRLIGQLSKGFQQRVGLAQALLHEPALVVLDEPASGLDPVQSVRMREVVRALRERQGVILSTHQLAEAQASCDRVAILHQGELRHVGVPDQDLEARFLRIAAGVQEAAA